LAGVVVALTDGSGSVTVLADSVAVVDPETGKVVADVPIGGRPIGIAVGGGAVWVANADDQTVSRIRSGHQEGGDDRSRHRRGS